MRFVCLILFCLILITACIESSMAVETMKMRSGEPLVGVYFFTHWWEPWRSSEEEILSDLGKLKKLGYNTIFLDSEWSQMIDGNWKLLDRGHKLAKQAGIEILPWLSAKVWLDVGTSDKRRELLKSLYGTDVMMGVDPDGKSNRTKPYDPALIEAGTKYCEQYIDRYIDNGALLRVKWKDGKIHPVVALTVELEWEGSCDPLTQQMFRVWLKGRYQDDIKTLNKKWKTSLTSFSDVDMCDGRVFDLKAHCEGKSTFPEAVEDHVEFRSQVTDSCLSEMKKRLLVKYPDLLIATELPYQFESTHPHAIGYRVVNGANPSSAYHADILMIRATDSLTPQEEKALLEYKKLTGQAIILTYRTYAQWGTMLLDGTRTNADMNRLYADQASRLAEGFGFYSWNEMVDTHLVPDPNPPFHPTSRITAKESAAVVKSVGEMAEMFVKGKLAVD